MNQLPSLFRQVCLIAIPVLGIAWLVDLPHHLGWAILSAEYISVIAGLAIAAGFLLKPTFADEPSLLDLALGVVAIGCWWWGAWNNEAWIVDIANRGIEKWLPGAVGLVLLVEAMRRNCGFAIAALVTVFLLYGLFGQALPGALEAAPTSIDRLAMYLYSDTNAVPGLVLRVGTTIVLAFILMGKVMEMSGASGFFTDSAMVAMGNRRGGPAKVAVVASSIFGTVNGTTVGNIMSTGIVTIPLMKRSGFPARYAAAIEAVASNGGQLAPPVMGTTAFLIAEFLQVSYGEVAMAAIVPAVIYYLVLFMQVDRYAVANGLVGLDRSQLPDLARTFRSGWIFLAPLAMLLYLLFWLGYNPGKSALYTATLMLILGLIQQRKFPDIEFCNELFVGAGRNLIPLLLVCGGAGIVIGVLNISGLGYSLVVILSDIAAAYGILVMLIVTAIIAIFLGMGMPTAAVYVVLSVVLAPALVNMGVPPMPAHLFIFYFGLLSMLTPPVAIASFVAAGLAGSDMWATGLTGLKLAASAYLLPFLFVFNPALVMQGTVVEIAIVCVTAVVSGGTLAFAIEGGTRKGLTGFGWSAMLFGAAIIVGSATLWLGSDNPLALAPAAVMMAAYLFQRRSINQIGGAKEKPVS
jgi:TRAP transporter 4TM/12TM fusion protein